MTAMPPPIPARLAPPFRFTLEQFFDMDRHGYFNHNRRVELLYGEVVEMSPVNWPHHISVGLVSDALLRVFAAGHFLDVQQTFPIPNSSLGLAPQPDVAVIPGARRDYTDHPTAAALLVEVSDATLTYDLTTKAEMYATAGIADYWVLDIDGRQLHVFRNPQHNATLEATAYQSHNILGPNDSISPLAAPTASVLVSDLLP